MSSGNKLVDKYQYNESSIKKDGQAEIIMARHIVLKQYFTLKKISLNQVKTYYRYQGIINEMSILKQLNSVLSVLKCHKMLKTSNNLYVVYDSYGSDPSLAKYLNTNPEKQIRKSKEIAYQILQTVKQMKQRNIIHLGLNLKNIQINQQNKIKIINAQSAVNFKKNINAAVFRNIQDSQYLAPELITFIQNQAHTPEKQIQVNILQENLQYVDIYSLGKIFKQIFNFKSEGKGLFSQQNTKSKFDRQISIVVEQMTSKNPNQRPRFIQIYKMFNNRNQQLTKSKSQLNINIPISPMKSSPGDLSPGIKQKNILTPTSMEFREEGRKSQNSINSLRSSQKYTVGDSPSKRKGSNHEITSSDQELLRSFTLRVLRRRNLCKFLLRVSLILNSLPMIESSLRIILSYLLVKKSVILNCSLARFLSTGKGQSEQFYFQSRLRKQFSKTEDFFKISMLISKQMDLARKMLQVCTQSINEQSEQLTKYEGFDYKTECRSQKINDRNLVKFVQLVVISLLKEIKKNQIQSKQRKYQLQKMSRNLAEQQEQQQFLCPSPTYSKRNQLFVQQGNFLSKSAKSIKSSRSISSSIGSLDYQQCSDQLIEKLISKDQLVFVYLMSTVIDFESYQKVFQNLILEQKTDFQKQTLYIQANKMSSKQLLVKLQQKFE